jgi:tripartite-type tricarboxylate transporter receptor subunit TctC
MLRNTCLFRFAAFAMGAIFATPAAHAAAPAPAAKDYPVKFIRMVVPYAAGAGPDVLGRILADKIGPSLGHNILLENRGGSGGALGSTIVAKAAPDGYTMLLNTAAHAAYPFFIKNLAYDPVKDLIPITQPVKNFGYVLVLNPSLPVKSVKDLIALAKANPGKLNYGTAGIGSAMQMAAELLIHLSGIKMTPVHYTGVPAALTDIISGQIEMGMPAVASVLPLVSSGRLRALAISNDKRWDKMPNVPTIAESGVKGYRYVGWYGLWFPAGTPSAYVNRIQSEVAKAVKDPVVSQQLAEQGLEGVGSTPEELAKLTEDEMALNKKLTAAMGIAPQ